MNPIDFAAFDRGGTVDLTIDFAVRLTHRLRFTRDVFSTDNDTLPRILAEDGRQPTRLLVFIDEGVARANPRLAVRIMEFAEHHGAAIDLKAIETISGGEACKNDQQLQYRLCHLIEEHGICRQSYVIAIGGGAVLDAVGFAAAIAHRGVRLIRMPTTTLSQDDSGVGVKNGINAFNKKNFLGAFASPWAVINDELFLETLSDRDWTAGFSEAVKVALIKDAALFERIKAEAPRVVQRDLAASMPIIQRSAELHIRHITEGGDPFELTTARPLDFGHWAAHKLEAMTYFDVRHGEAVAIGIALDVTYAGLVGLMHDDDVQEVLDCLEALGFQLYHPAMRDADTLLKGLEEFREHLGGRLTIAMLKGIGRQHDVHEIDTEAMRQAIEALGERATTLA